MVVIRYKGIYLLFMSSTSQEHRLFKRGLGAKAHPLQCFLFFLGLGLSLFFSLLFFSYNVAVAEVKNQSGFYSQVNKSFVVLDDGRKSRSFIADNNVSSTRFGWYQVKPLKDGLLVNSLIEVQSSQGASSRIGQQQVGGSSSSLQTRHARVGVQGPWGELLIGHTSSATDRITEEDLGALSSVLTPSPARWAGAARFRYAYGGVSAIQLENVADGFDGIAFSGARVADGLGSFGNGFADRFPLVRYNGRLKGSASGVTLSAAYTTEQHADFALRYKKALKGGVLAFGLGYVRYDAPDRFTNLGMLTEAQNKVKDQLSGHFSAVGNHGFAVTLTGGKRYYKRRAVGLVDPWFTYIKLSKAFGGSAYKVNPQGKWALAVEYGHYKHIDTSFIGHSALHMYGVGVERELFKGVSGALFGRMHKLKRTGPALKALNVVGVNLKVKF